MSDPKISNIVSRSVCFIWGHRFIFIGLACSLLLIAFMVSGAKRVIFFDEHEYLTIASNLIKSGVYGYTSGVPSAARPPGYILFIAPIVALGFGKTGVVVVQILLWGASIYLTGLICYNLRGPIAAGFAIVFATLYPLCSFVTLTVYPQILTAFLVLLFLLEIIKRGQTNVDLGKAIRMGLITGLTILTSPILLPILFGVLVILPFVARRWLRSTIVAILISCCVVGPWIGRNWIVMGSPSISNIVGFNLLYGNSENASPELGSAANIDKYANAVRGLNEVDTDRALRNFALEWIYNNPVSALKLYVGKFMQFFGYTEVIKTKVHGVAIFQTAVALLYYPLLLLSVLGVIYFVANRNGPCEIFMFVLYVVAAAWHAVFEQRLRYRVEVDFLIIVIASDFLGMMIRSITDGSRIIEASLPAREHNLKNKRIKNCKPEECGKCHTNSTSE